MMCEACNEQYYLDTFGEQETPMRLSTNTLHVSTAGPAYAAAYAEAMRELEQIRTALEDHYNACIDVRQPTHWGHVGYVHEIVKALKEVPL